MAAATTTDTTVITFNELLSGSEVADLETKISGVAEDILWLDVSMTDTDALEVGE